jgi:uncharacterized protein VirK/YbjX
VRLDRIIRRLDLRHIYKLTFLLIGRRDRSVIKDTLKLLLGAIVYPLQTRRWRDYIKSRPVLGKLARRYPKILHKIYRPYLDTRLSCRDRVDVLVAHYDRLFEFGLADFLDRAAISPISVAEFAGKTGSLFQVQLSAIRNGHREGELTLKLLHNGTCVYSASFLLGTSHGTPSIAIGALQGLRSLDGGQVIKAVTRELHGCRPKKLLVDAVRAVGDYFGCTNMLLISNQNLVTINGRRASRISSNYDETWQEMGAFKGQDGNFHLPCKGAAPNLDMVASNKRAEARRRIDLLASMSASIRLGMEGQRMTSTTSLVRLRPASTWPQVSGNESKSSNDSRIDLLLG